MKWSKYFSKYIYTITYCLFRGLPYYYYDDVAYYFSVKADEVYKFLVPM